MVKAHGKGVVGPCDSSSNFAVPFLGRIFTKPSGFGVCAAASTWWPTTTLPLHLGEASIYK